MTSPYLWLLHHLQYLRFHYLSQIDCGAPASVLPRPGPAASPVSEMPRPVNNSRKTTHIVIKIIRHVPSFPRVFSHLVETVGRSSRNLRSPEFGQ